MIACYSHFAPHLSFFSNVICCVFVKEFIVDGKHLQVVNDFISESDMSLECLKNK